MRYSSYSSDADSVDELMKLEKLARVWNPWPQDRWLNIVRNYWCSHVTYGMQPVGFIVGSQGSVDLANFRIIRCAVDPAFRRRGITKYLMAYASEEARRGGTATKLDLWVRETETDPIDYPEWDLVPWLTALKFQAVETKENFWNFCGQTEAGIRFERKLFTIDEVRKQDD